MNNFSVSAVFLICMTIMILAFTGDPDLIDGVVIWLSR